MITVKEITTKVNLLEYSRTVQKIDDRISEQFAGKFTIEEQLENASQKFLKSLTKQLDKLITKQTKDKLKHYGANYVSGNCSDYGCIYYLKETKTCKFGIDVSRTDACGRGKFDDN